MLFRLSRALIVSGFSKGLGTVVAAKATVDLARLLAMDKVLLIDPAMLLEVTKAVVSKA